MNVKINALSLKDEAVANELVAEANELIEKAQKAEAEILALVDERITR